MKSRVVLPALTALLVALGCLSGSAQSRPLEINARIHTPFRFVAYGDTRFTDPGNTAAANAEVRQQLVLRARIVVFSGHVHNYERHEHGAVTYFVTGGGGAHAYPITRALM